MKKQNTNQPEEQLIDQSEGQLDEKSEEQPQKRRKRGLSAAIMWLLIVLFITLAVVIAVVSYRLMSNMLLERYSQKAEEVVAFESTQIDGDRILEYEETLETDEYYDEVMLKLNSMKESMDELAYLYVFVPHEDHFVYIWDSFREGEDMDYISVLGDVYEYSETEYELLVPDVEAERASDQMIYGQDVGFGTSLSAWCPIFNSDDELVAMVEADYQFENLSAIIMRRIVPIIAVMTIALIVLLVLVLFFLRKRVTKPLSSLTDYVNAYQSGAEERSSFAYKKDDEIQWLGTAFDEMSDRIEQYIVEVTHATAEKERISSELSVATNIQADMLPSNFPAFPEHKEFDIFATMNPAKEVGGDFYDFFLIDDKHLGLVMADVSGKGVPAALFMVIAKTMIKNRALMGGTPGEILSDVNNQLCEGNKESLFVTVWLGIVDLTTGVVTETNAGHEYPAIRHKDGSFELLKTKHSPAVAVMEDFPFRNGEFRLEAGDRLFVYTDGCPEATNAFDTLFGNDRLVESLNKHKDETLPELLHGLREDIDAFVGEAPQFDDVTMLGFDFFGPQA